MEFFCLERFKAEFEKLKSKKSYRSLEKDIIDYFVGKSCAELKNGTRLNGSDETPFIKKRLRGSGGYRVYYLLLVKDDKLYFMFVHPKTGPHASSNITDESKAKIYKEVLVAIASNDLYAVDVNEANDGLTFAKLD